MEREPQIPNKKEDFHDLDLVRQVMVSGAPDQLERLKSFLLEKGVSKKQIEVSIKLQKLRDKIHRDDLVELRSRANTNTEPTPEELNPGAYIEMLESPVREAILSMRRKGYNTYYSGFHYFNYQLVGFAEPLNFTPEVIEQLQVIGIKIKKRELQFECHSDDLELLKDQWNKIADILPDLGHPASSASRAKQFQREYRDGKLKEIYGKYGESRK